MAPLNCSVPGLALTVILKAFPRKAHQDRAEILYSFKQMSCNFYT